MVRFVVWLVLYLTTIVAFGQCGQFLLQVMAGYSCHSCSAIMFAHQEIYKQEVVTF